MKNYNFIDFYTDQIRQNIQTQWRNNYDFLSKSIGRWKQLFQYKKVDENIIRQFRADQKMWTAFFDYEKDRDFENLKYSEKFYKEFSKEISNVVNRYVHIIGIDDWDQKRKKNFQNYKKLIDW